MPDTDTQHETLYIFRNCFGFDECKQRHRQYPHPSILLHCHRTHFRRTISVVVVANAQTTHHISIRSQTKMHLPTEIIHYFGWSALHAASMALYCISNNRTFIRYLDGVSLVDTIHSWCIANIAVQSEFEWRKANNSWSNVKQSNRLNCIRLDCSRAQSNFDVHVLDSVQFINYAASTLLRTPQTIAVTSHVHISVEIIFSRHYCIIIASLSKMYMYSLCWRVRRTERARILRSDGMVYVRTEDFPDVWKTKRKRLD